MTANDEVRPTRRVVVLLDDSRASRAALEAAVELAVREQAELIGLFVEDTDLLRSASLPFGREIGLTSGSIRPINLDELERRLRRQAEDVRRRLAAIGHRHSVRWRFQVSRGRPDAAMLSATTPDDLLVVTRVGWRRRPGAGFGSPAADRIASGARCSVMILSERIPAGDRPVLVLYEGSEAGRRILAAAARLASHASEGLVILLPASSDDPGEILETAARQWAQHHGARVRFLRLGREDAGTLVALLRRERGRALVLGRESRAMRTAAGRSLLDEIDTPVVVVP